MCYSIRTGFNLSDIGKLLDISRDTALIDEFKLQQANVQNMAAAYLKEALGLARKPQSSLFRWAPDEIDQRAYPGYFLPAIVALDGKNIVSPMRYRIRPNGSATEIPTKYNVFNCREDAIDHRRTWQSVFTRKHALVPFSHFYEWVNTGSAKRQVAFHPSGHSLMWAPALYDEWVSQDGAIQFKSLAIITREPPPEVLAAGHDRCPIFMSPSVVNDWLRPERFTYSQCKEMLKYIKQPFYRCEYVN